MILAPMTEDRDESLEAIDILIERVASNLDQLRQVVIRDVAYKSFTPLSECSDNRGGEAEG
jgi:hypothetical protein